MHDLEGPSLFVALLVGVVQRRGHAQGNGEHVLEGDRVATLLRLAQDDAQVLAVDVLHGEEEVVTSTAHVVHPHDVGVPQPRRQVRLVTEHADEIGVRGEVRAHALEHHELRTPIRTRGARQIQLGHPTGCEPFEELVPRPLGTFEGRA